MLVSAGFDAARGDPLGGYQVTPEGYAHLTHQLMSLAAGRVLVILEVGYIHSHMHNVCNLYWWVFQRLMLKSITRHILTIKRTKDLNYFSLCALNLFNTRVSQFELNYWNKCIFPRHSNLLRCTCILLLLFIFWHHRLQTDVAIILNIIMNHFEFIFKYKNLILNCMIHNITVLVSCSLGEHKTHLWFHLTLFTIGRI